MTLNASVSICKGSGCDSDGSKFSAYHLEKWVACVHSKVMTWAKDSNFVYSQGSPTNALAKWCGTWCAESGGAFGNTCLGGFPANENSSDDASLWISAIKGGTSPRTLLSNYLLVSWSPLPSTKSACIQATDAATSAFCLVKSEPSKLLMAGRLPSYWCLKVFTNLIHSPTKVDIQVSRSSFAPHQSIPGWSFVPKGFDHPGRARGALWHIIVSLIVSKV
jgi:hypothetical protein